MAEIVVSPATSTLVLDAQLPLRALVQDGSGEIVSDADVTWTVEDPRIVSVSTAGVVRALAVGTSQVAASALGKSGIALVTVAPLATGGADSGGDDSGAGNAGGDADHPAESDPGSGTSDGDSGGDAPGDPGPGAVATVTVAAPSEELEVGSTMQLTATARDEKGSSVPQESFVWSSSNTDKATVSASGVVAAKEPGNVTITATTSPAGEKSGSLRIRIKK